LEKLKQLNKSTNLANYNLYMEINEHYYENGIVP